MSSPISWDLNKALNQYSYLFYLSTNVNSHGAINNLHTSITTRAQVIPLVALVGTNGKPVPALDLFILNTFLGANWSIKTRYFSY